MTSGQVAHTKGARVVGLVACVPRRRIDNAFFSERFGAQVADVVKMTGVEARYWVEGDQTTSDLCERAAQSLLQGLAWEKTSVDALIFVSQTPDYRLPATACSLQARLGLRAGIIAFDVTLGCSGYVYGLWLAMTMIQGGAAKRVLLAVGDTSSRVVDANDRGTAMLFGDAGTVTAVEASEGDSDATFVLGTDGAGAENLIIPDGAFRSCLGNPRLEGRATDKLFMDGGEIFNFTLKAVPGLIRDAATAAGLSLDQYDAFLLHQANAFMIRHLAKKTKLPAEKVPINIDRYGNTSSATIPLLMASDLAERLRLQRLSLCLVGFGVGYSWGAASTSVGPLRFVETTTL